MFAVHCTVYIVNYTVQCTLYTTLYCTLYCIVYIVLYTVHSRLWHTVFLYNASQFSTAWMLIVILWTTGRIEDLWINIEMWHGLLLFSQTVLYSQFYYCIVLYCIVIMYYCMRYLFPFGPSGSEKPCCGRVLLTWLMYNNSLCRSAPGYARVYLKSSFLLYIVQKFSAAMCLALLACEVISQGCGGVGPWY